MTATASRTFGRADAAALPTDPGLRLMLILSVLMSFASISTDIYLPALPTIARELHAQRGAIELTMSSFLVGFAAGQLLWGPIGDRRGRRLPIALGLVLFVAGSAGCALSPGIGALLFWRAVQAAGACAGPVLARAMVRDLYGREHAARMLSTLILIMGVAPLAGPLLGGQVLLHASWRAIFWLLVVFGLATLVLLLALPETLPAARRTREPMAAVLRDYLQLAREPRLLGYALAGGFFYAGIYAFLIGTPFVYIELYHVPAQGYGLLFALNIVGMMAANWLNARLLPRLGSERLFRIGTRILAVSGLSVALAAWSGLGGLPALVVPMFFYMAMNGLIVANSVAGALADYPRQAGTASSLVGAMHYGAGILSAALVGALADGSARPMASVMGVAGVGAMASAGLPALMKARREAR